MPPPLILCPEDLDFWLGGWESMQSRQGFARSDQNHAKESIPEGAAPPLPGGLDICAEELPREGGLLPGGPKRWERGLGDATQALFQASICQAQMCVLDLQGELNRKETGPPKSFPLHPTQKVLELPWVQDSAFSHEPVLLDTDSGEEEGEEEEEEEEEESFGRQEEEEGLSEEEEEEEMEGLFYDNPLFQESPGPARSASFKEPALGDQQAGRPLSLRDGTHDNSLFPKVCQFQAQECFPAQPAHSVSENPDAGADPPAQGLLFSTCSTSLMSALLQEAPECHTTQQPPPSPREYRRTVPHSSPVPSALVEWGPWRKKSEPRDSFCGCQSPSYAWAKALGGTSCLREGACAHDLHPASLSGPGRKLEEDSVEGFVVAELPAGAAEGGGREKEEKEEDPAAQQQNCPQGLSGNPGHMALDLGTKEQVQPEGSPLFANGTSGDQAAALRLATRLYHLDGFKRSQVAAFLRKNNEFSQLVAEAYLSFFHFRGQALDQALRSFLKAFVLTGETQERERILQHFSQRYHNCNPEAFLSPDAVHTLTCALMLLNTDLHGQKVGRSMSCQAFLSNLDGLNDGQNFPKELVKGLYHSIRQEKLQWAVDEEEASSTPTRTQPPSASSQKKSNPFLTLLHDSGTQTYRQGLLARKVHAEADGKKTPWGRRGWKSFHTVLKGTVLYFFKDENWTEALEEPVGVLHALAERASKYTKRPHVFRLQTADWSIFLFQAQTAEEMSSWISHINLVAAMFSSPPFPEAVGSQRKFTRPILPTAPCKNSLEDQYQAHEGYMDKASDDLQELQRNLPDKRSRGQDLEEYQLRKEYLLYEKRRYEAYVRLLEVKLSCAGIDVSEDPDQWAAHLREAAEEGSCPGLQKSYSSPSLNVEGPPTAPTGVKVKRNISERRTVRKIITRRNKHLL
ncbi:PH and SEC7 domain-containing protein 4-like isoform X2 [Sceloporus undulatus]|uniref:PH and SEC7 domain-containing protein 4-like isoform X2 n=1 Tax=Sceloporus undulatus TaxID=8520 RepID=UPI001C4C6AE4|nr:PH and SEC7 domain-containing protein 4-like isoform X2 [Sceloporus undulatus]